MDVLAQHEIWSLIRLSFSFPRVRGSRGIASFSRVGSSGMAFGFAALAQMTLGFAALSGMRSPPARSAMSNSRPREISMSTRGIVITGGAGGVGYAYADELLRLGHWVVICDVKDPDPAVQALRAKHAGGVGRVYGTVCDVSSAPSVEKLAQFAKESIGTVHYWINNAGINGGRRPFTTLSTSTVEAVVKVNLIGVLLCTKVALELMQEQNGVTSHVSNTRTRARTHAAAAAAAHFT